jgi:hypothetical protein
VGKRPVAENRYSLPVVSPLGFMSYQVIRPDQLSFARYPKHNWPLAQLAINEAFVIPMAEGVDIDGRSEAYIRTLIHKASQRIGRKLSCRKTEDGDLAIIRLR